MKRRHLVVLVSAFTLLTILFVMAVTIGVGVGTSPGREQIRALIQQQVGARVRGKVHLGNIRGRLLGGFTIDTFAIRDLEDSLLVSTGRVTVEYDLRDLMDRRLLLRNLQVEHPFIRLRQYAKGDWNFQRVFRAGGPSVPNVPGRSFGDFVVLDSVRIRNGTFLLSRPWTPDDTLTGAKRDSAIRVNMANPNREIRRNTDGLTHTHRWSRMTGFMPHARIANPDSNKFGQHFVIESLNVEELEPPFSFRNARGTIDKIGDSIFVDIKKFDLPASTGSATAKLWWGGGKPLRIDVRIQGDSVSLNDVAFVYPTLPRTGGGRTKLRITNEEDHRFEYALTEMDVRSTRSRITGAMTFVVGGPVLQVRNVDLRADPVNFDLVRTLAGAPFPIDWQGDLSGYAKGPGGPLTNFVVSESDVTWRDSHVPGAVSRLRGRGELDILKPAYTNFHGFGIDVATLDLRSIEFLFPSFPRLGGTVAGVARLDSSWLDVRFSQANVTHQNGPGEPTRVTGAGRVTWDEKFMKYDVAVNVQPLSLTMMSRAYPLGLKGLLSGPIQARGTTNDLQINAQLDGLAGRFTYNGRVDAYPLSVAAKGSGRVEGLDLAQLLAEPSAPPGWLTGAYQLDIRGDTNDLGTLRGMAALQLERGEMDSIRVFQSRFRARFANGRVFIDTLRVESVAATITATGALGLTDRAADSLQYQVSVDSLGGLRRYVSRLTSAWAQPPAGTVAMVDSLAGSLVLSGVARGSLRSLEVAGRVSGSNVFVRREAGRQISATFALSNVLTQPSGTASIRFDTLDLGGILLDTLGASIRFEAARTGVFDIAALARNGVTLSANGEMAMGAADAAKNVILHQLAVVTDSSRWALRGPARIDALSGGFAIDSLVLANGRGGRIALAGLVPDSGRARILFRADSVSLYDFGRVAQLKAPLSGWARIGAQGAGTSSAPVMNMQATLTNVRYGGIHVERVNAIGEYLNRRGQVSLDLERNKRTALFARGSLPIELKYFGARLLDDSLQGTIRTDSASFDIVEAFIPTLREATGRLVANIDVGGTWKHPDVAGALRVENGEVTIEPLGVRVKGVQVELALFGHSDSLAIRRIVGWSGATAADSISLRGYVAYRELDNPYVDLRLHARTFRALDRRTLARLDVSTEPNGMRLRGRMIGATLTGGLIVDRGTIYLPDPELRSKQLGDLNAQVTDSSETLEDALPAPSSRIIESLLLDGVRVTLGDAVQLESRDVSIKLTGALNVRRSTDPRRLAGGGTRGATSDTVSYRLALEGVLFAEKGTYTFAPVYGFAREFQVESGTITFLGSSELAPELNISALHAVKRSNQPDLRIRVRLTGPLTTPIVALESAESYAISSSDLVSYLIFGVPSFALGDQETRTMNLALQAITPTGQALVSQVGRLIGLGDYLQLRLGSLNAEQLTGGRGGDAWKEFFYSTRLGTELQVRENLFFSVSAGIFCQLSSAGSTLLEGVSGKIEYRFSPYTSIKGGREPPASALNCTNQLSGRAFVQTPSQWGLSLFKSWRF